MSTAQTSCVEASHTVEYGIAPHLRRACLWAMGGLVCVVATQVALEMWVAGMAGPPGPQAAERIAVLGCMVVALALPLRWRVRVDEHGVARRRVLGWTQWTWAELESGCVLKQGGLRLVHPHRPWWNRSLDLMWMGDARASEVMALINTRYRLPPAPPIPAELRLQLSGRKRVIADHLGLRVTTRTREERFAWSEVPAIWIRRHDPKRRDFAHVRFALPAGAQALEFPLAKNGSDSRGPPREVISAFLLRHAAHGCVRERLTGAPLESEDRATLEHWLSQTTKAHREWRIVNLAMLMALASLLAWMAVGTSLASAAPTIGLLVFFIGPVAWAADREHRSKIARLAAAMEASAPVTETMRYRR
jgi:hypothetical protein